MASTMAWTAVQQDAESVAGRCSRCLLNDASWRMGYELL